MLSKGELEQLLGHSLDDEMRTLHYDLERQTGQSHSIKILPRGLMMGQLRGDILKVSQRSTQAPLFTEPTEGEGVKSLEQGVTTR